VKRNSTPAGFIYASPAADAAIRLHDFVLRSRRALTILK
jgi:hypothetical protein